MDIEKPREDAPPSSNGPEGPPRRFQSSDLFVGGSRRLIIRHNGRDYVLIITKRGKLVLNLLG